jgi:hypothetical protein
MCVDVCKEINTQKKNWNYHKMEWTKMMAVEFKLIEKFVRRTI